MAPGFELLSELDGASRADMVSPEGIVVSSAQWAFILQTSSQSARNNSMPSTLANVLSGSTQHPTVPGLH